MGLKAKSVRSTKAATQQSPSNTYSFSSSGYSSQSLSEFDHHNRTSSNYTINANNHSISDETSAFRVRTSTPTTTDNDISCVQYPEPAIFTISQQQQHATHAKIVKTSPLVDNNNDISINSLNNTFALKSFVSFFIKCLSCFNIFSIFKHKNKNKNSQHDAAAAKAYFTNKLRSAAAAANRNGSPVNSIYDNFNDDIQKYYKQEAAKIRTQNNYEYRPSVFSYDNNSFYENTNRYIRPQQVAMTNTKQIASLPITTPVTASMTNIKQQHSLYHHNTNNYQVPVSVIAPVHQLQQSYYNDHTRNSTFINTLNDARVVTMQPYLSSSSISSIESSINNQSKVRSYSVDSVNRTRNQAYKPRYTQQQQRAKYPKSNSIDSVIASSVSTSVSSLAASTSTSSLAVSPPKKHYPQTTNLQFISPIVSNNTNEYNLVRQKLNYRPKYLSTNNNTYDSAPKVMIQLEKMSLNRRQSKSRQYQQNDRQFPLLKPLYDDYLCDKEVEGYFENPVYFDCYQQQQQQQQETNNSLFHNHNNVATAISNKDLKTKNLVNSAINYYARCNEFKSESYC